MFLVRFLTAAALSAAFLAALFLLERPALSWVIALIVAGGGHEWATLSGLRTPWSWAYAGLCAVIYFIFSQIGWLSTGLLALANVFWIVFVPAALSRGLAPTPASGNRLGGFAVLVPAGVAMTAMPPKFVLMVLGLVWVADTAAYLVGSTFGKRKLAPAISPGKTWEGVAGGAVATLIYAIICAMFFPGLGGAVEGMIWVPFLGGALLLFALSVLGDLFESALKRQAGVKDSGKLLPGHGGVLDRIDSATATLPVAALLLQALRAV